MKNTEDKYIKNASEKNFIIKYILWGLLILSPILILIIESVFWGKNLLLTLPEWTDELEYWREVYSFSNNGFSFGGSYFFGHDASVGPLGAHSVTPIVAWGPFFLFFKTSLNIHIILWANLIYLIAAWAVFVILNKPGIKKTAMAMCIACLFPYVILYLHTSMIEMVCLSGIIVFFSLYLKWDYESNDKKNRLIFIFLLVVGIWCTMLRPTYVVILFPVIWAKNKYKISIKLIIGLIVYVLIFGLFYKAYSVTSSTYPNGIMYWLSGIDNFKDKILYILRNVRQNAIRYFNPTADDLCQFGLRMLNLFLIFYTLIVGIVREKKRKYEGRPELALSLVLLGNIAAMILLYDIADWRDFRSLAPVVFGGLLFVIIKEKDYRLVATVMAMFCVSFGLFIASKDNNIDNRRFSEYKDLSSYFSSVEQTDENGDARTIVFDSTLNWCDISIVSSIPSKMGYQVFWGEAGSYIYQKADYVFLPVGVENECGELEVSIPDYGCLYRMFE